MSVISHQLSQAKVELSRLKKEEEFIKQRLPKKAKTVRIKNRKNSNEIKKMNTQPAPQPAAAASETSPFSPPPLEPESSADAEAAYDFDSQGADETLR